MAILAEKYAVDYSWYVDTILNLIRIAGDYVSEEVWYRVIQIVINRDDVQGYAAKTVFEVYDTRCSNCHFLYTFRKLISTIITILRATLFVHFFFFQFPQALQAPACHENMVKVGGYILGEFGNLIAGDPRSR